MSVPVILHQKREKIKQLETIQSPYYQTSTNLINIPLNSVFVKKFSQKHKTQHKPTEEAHPQQIDQFHESQLTKFKYYSKILQSSNTLSQFHHRENHSPKSQHKNTLPHEEQSAQMFNEKQKNKKVLVHNYYTSKNQRKHKVLNKAKQLGKFNFSKFLKQTIMIQHNKHFHQFRDQANVSRKGSPPDKRELSQKKQQISPMIFSLKPMKEHIQIAKMTGKSQLSETISIKQIRKKLKFQTEPATQQVTQHSSLGVTTQITSGKNNNQQGKNTSKKGVIRSLTSINEQVRQTRQTKYKEQFLFKQQESKKIRNLQDLMQQWKYKSQFNSEYHSQEESIKNKRLENTFQKELFGSKRPKRSFFSSKQRQIRNWSKSQSVRNSNFRNSLPKTQKQYNLSFNVKSLMPSLKQL